MNTLELSWDKLKDNIIDIESQYDELTKQKYGIYWTDIDLAYQIIDNLFTQIDADFIRNISRKKILEPCVGMGSFIFAFLRKIYELNMGLAEVNEIINNIFFCDIHKRILESFYTCYRQFVSDLWGIRLTSELFNRNSLTGLIHSTKDEGYIGLDTYFLTPIKFDLVITNPPYKNLKINAKDYESQTAYQRDKTYYKTLSYRLKKEFFLANKGVLNLYKLFTEKILTEYTNENAYVSLLIPNTFLADRSTFDIRKYCLEQCQIKQIDIFSEKNQFFRGVTQAFANLYIHTKPSKTTQNQNIKFTHAGKPSMHVSTDIFAKVDNNLSLYPYTPNEISKLIKLNNFPKISELDFVINMRGELDLTQYKSFMTEASTQLPLLKGKHIAKYENINIDTFADKTFVDKTSKSIYIKQARLACPQISNQTRSERIKFCWVNPNIVLANSCNFIAVEDNTLGYDLYYFLGLLNTSVINWYFNKFNSNNHIGNYEIDNFPVHTNIEVIQKISDKTKEYLQTKKIHILAEIENICLQGFQLLDTPEVFDNRELYKKELLIDLTKNSIVDEKRYYKQVLSKDLSKFENLTILAEALKDYYLSHSILMNNMGFKLSELDLEMIRQVPQGGNWRDISAETTQKSQRLIKINQTGGRTTLYGRIKYDEPAYTVTTYFNRPGNGTYVHPTLDRVITAREASRLQSFPDDYYFYGNKKDILTQIGNAVPCLFAQRIGERLCAKLPSLQTFGDLFCGAGGMSQGMNQAGLTSIFANDIALPACVTYQVNHPNTRVINGSILEDDIKRQIYTYQGQIDILCGGPPCQGFSHAGKRIIDDPRNQLFLEFIDSISVLKPKVVVMENVQGFLTLDKGKFYQQTKELLQELGYICEGKLMNTVHFGVPQKRKRVIIIGVHKDYIGHHSIHNFFPIPTTEESSKQINVFQSIADLENITPNSSHIMINNPR